ncbi:mitochondrial fission ELM1 family protein [Pseudohaliea rubra]|uniref:Domain protein-containing protein n=1 Tax=Pseudohaliea rubra DSM 19751 TaxID=1265313 RepID=A0A095VPG0_9GAMM|nr:ELM1/GtrOC1 family putative glycosyltransferase [Pseudohaliea rubra]KGE02993.1 domain protein-containing protein [Pseudohaliea rubra DSM 19751]
METVVWLLQSDRAGDNNQVLALGELLGLPATRKRIVYRSPVLLPKIVSARSRNLLVAGVDRRRSAPLAPPWPALVISAGREMEPVARWIRRQSGGRTRLVHMGRPWAPLEAFDLVISTPQYALPERDNVLMIGLPLHRVHRARLAAAASVWGARFAHLPGPRTAVLLGGSSGSFVFSPRKGAELGRLVNARARAEGGSLLVTDSARTCPATFEAFRAELTVPVYVYRWQEGAAANPYFAFLGVADRLVTTGESVSMLAEASVTGKPLLIYDLAEHLPVDAGAWQRLRAALCYHALRDRFARLLGPAYMQRDIEIIQRQLVASGRADWLNRCGGNLREAAPRPAAMADDLRALGRIRDLLGLTLPC